MLQPDNLARVQQALSDAGLDGWLLFDFHGVNPVSSGFVGVAGMVTRRYFVLIPRRGMPVAVTHSIEQGPWKHWPAQWEKTQYSGWRTLEAQLQSLVAGKLIAMEYSPGDAVPYLDRIPAGVIEMVREAGATVVSSADLVTQFYAAWSDEQFDSHSRAAEIIAEIAQLAFERAAKAARGKAPLQEFALKSWILQQFTAAGLETDHGPIVAIARNAANPHYEPTEEHSAEIVDGSVLLIDLWAREPDGVFADQTWMACLREPDEREIRIWNAVRDARDAAIGVIADAIRRRERIMGAEVDDAARHLIEARGFGEYFIHRTGHSIDPRALHGSGPHIDNLETREVRRLVPGVGFSIEPGIYLAGDIGMRSEVNGFIARDGLRITPGDYQRELLIF